MLYPFFQNKKRGFISRIHCGVLSFLFLFLGLGLPQVKGQKTATATVSLLVVDNTYDTDNDSIADVWEKHFYKDEAGNGDLTRIGHEGDFLDTDGDGLLDRDEFFAGTHPKDPTDVLRMVATGSADEGASFTMTWTRSNEDWSSLTSNNDDDRVPLLSLPRLYDVERAATVSDLLSQKGAILTAGGIPADASLPHDGERVSYGVDGDADIITYTDFEVMEDQPKFFYQVHLLAPAPSGP